MTDEVHAGSDTRCGFVALIGAPNVGKSTLVNALVGAKVTIVSPKVQTTRALVRGIAMEGKSQIVLVDTPGIFAPKRRLDRAMVTTAWAGAQDADLVCVLIDAKRGLDDETGAMLGKLPDVAHRKVLVINKVDAVDKPKLLKLAEEVNKGRQFDATFMVSALKGDGVDDLRKHLGQSVSPGPWLYPEDEIADAPAQSLSTEITREKLFHKLHQELPYQLTVEVEQWKELRGGALRIEQTIYVER